MASSEPLAAMQTIQRHVRISTLDMERRWQISTQVVYLPQGPNVISVDCREGFITLVGVHVHGVQYMSKKSYRRDDHEPSTGPWVTDF